tara:strand:- start:5043 stop:6323 length:1281 start_codon:yes stop_codon:yes gene_type:complete
MSATNSVAKYELGTELGSETEIPRSSWLNRAIFVAKASSPFLSYKIAKATRSLGNQDIETDRMILQRTTLSNSKTFAYSLPVFDLGSSKNEVKIVRGTEQKSTLREKFTAVHQGFQTIDLIADNPKLTNNEKKELADKCRECLINPEGPEEVEEIRQALRNLPRTGDSEKYDNLVEHFDSLARVLSAESKGTRSAFGKYSREMIDGMTDPEVQYVETLEDEKKVNYFDAVCVGKTINDLYAEVGLITPAQSKFLRTTINENNPTVSMAMAYQRANDLRDVFDDTENGIQKWRKKDVDQLLSAINEGSVQEAFKGPLTRMYGDVKEWCYKSVDYLESLLRMRRYGQPFKHIIFPAFGLAAYAITASTTYSPEFIRTQGASSKKKFWEYLDALDVTTNLIRKEDADGIRSYLGHILEEQKPSRTFRRT